MLNYGLSCSRSQRVDDLIQNLKFIIQNLSSTQLPAPMAKTGFAGLALALSLLAGPAIPARGQAPVPPAPVRADSTGVRPSAPAARWYRSGVFRTVAAPALLIGYGVAAVGERGFPVSSQDVYRARQRH